MTMSLFFRVMFSSIAILALSEPAFAQQALCRQLRAQLSSLDSSGGGRGQQLDASVAKQRAEIARTTNYYNSLGCQGRGFLIFNAPPPPECGALAGRIQQMQSNHAKLAYQAERSGGGPGREGQRQQLLAAITEVCRVQAEPVPSRNGIYETLFGRARPEPLEDDSVIDETDDERRPRGGSRAVCVRSCDGFFFPMNNLPNGREGADDMCQALCPGTEARAYFMPGGDGVIEQAVSSGGSAYTSLANASRYQKAFDSSCSCRKQGQSWYEALKSAEDMIERRRGDIIVTAQKAEELSRAKTTATIAVKETKASKAEAAKLEEQKRKAALAEAEAASMASTAAAAPTASTESAGIGPQKIENEKVIGRNDGAKSVVTNEDGSRRQIRIVAPELIAPLKPRL
jgi:hypothetical protein